MIFSSYILVSLSYMRKKKKKLWEILGVMGGVGKFCVFLGFLEVCMD